MPGIKLVRFQRVIAAYKLEAGNRGTPGIYLLLSVPAEQKQIIMKLSLKVRVVAALLCLAGLSGAGCVNYIQELPPETAGLPSGEGYQKSRALLDAFFNDDAESFCAMLPENFRKEFTPQHYQATRKSLVDSMGEPVSFSYVTSLELPVFTPHIWKVRFRRLRPDDGMSFTSEALLRVITAQLDGETIITAFQFL